MTKEPESHFDQRADNAALMLKGDLSRKLGKDIPSVQVAVGPDGKPPPPPPPQGSYAAMQLEQEQRAAVMHQQQQPQVQAQPEPQNQQQILGQQPQIGPTQAIDGSVAPPLHPTAPPQQDNQEELSPNVQQRFTALSQQLRDLDQQNQTNLEDLKARDANIAQLQASLEDSQRQQQEILQANLDELDPDTRAKVLADSRMKEMFENFARGLEQNLTAKFSPAIESLNVDAQKRQMMDLARKYPAFDIQVHENLIAMYRGKNPNSSVEQAFKAIAQPGELITRDAAPLQVAPPIVSPDGAGGMSAQPRYLPEPVVDPESQMKDDARRAAELLRSNSHVDRKEGIQLYDKNIKERLANSLPG